MVAAKPDCTGQRFGQLTVLGKGRSIRTPCKRKGKPSFKTRQLWKLLCDCGKTVELPRGYFDRPVGGQKACGCLYRDRKGKPQPDRKFKPGQKFGKLTTVARVPGKIMYRNKPVWFCQCECGAIVERSTQHLKQGYGKGKGCDECITPYLQYPPTPSPYPSEAGEIVAKYLYRTQTNATKIDTAIQDEIIDRLIRSAWILVYRRWQGEDISELKERRYINKCLRYAATQVRLRRKLEQDGGLTYTIDNRKIKIGGKMTDLTSQDYPVAQQAETQEKVMLPKTRIKFKRC